MQSDKRWLDKQMQTGKAPESLSYKFAKGPHRFELNTESGLCKKCALGPGTVNHFGA